MLEKQLISVCLNWSVFKSNQIKHIKRLPHWHAIFSRPFIFYNAKFHLPTIFRKWKQMNPDAWYSMLRFIGLRTSRWITLVFQSTETQYKSFSSGMFPRIFFMQMNKLKMSFICIQYSVFDFILEIIIKKPNYAYLTSIRKGLITSVPSTCHRGKMNNLSNEIVFFNFYHSSERARNKTEKKRSRKKRPKWRVKREKKTTWHFIELYMEWIQPLSMSLIQFMWQHERTQHSLLLNYDSQRSC